MSNNRGIGGLILAVIGLGLLSKGKAEATITPPDEGGIPPPDDTLPVPMPPVLTLDKPTFGYPPRQVAPTILDIDGIPFVEVGRDSVLYGVLAEPRRVSAYRFVNSNWVIHWQTTNPGTFDPSEPGQFRFRFTLKNGEGIQVHRGSSSLVGHNALFEGYTRLTPYGTDPPVTTPGLYYGKFSWELYIGGDISSVIYTQYFRVENMLQIG